MNKVLLLSYFVWNIRHIFTFFYADLMLVNKYLLSYTLEFLVDFLFGLFFSKVLHFYSFLVFLMHLFNFGPSKYSIVWYKLLPMTKCTARINTKKIWKLTICTYKHSKVKSTDQMCKPTLCEKLLPNIPLSFCLSFLIRKWPCCLSSWNDLWTVLLPSESLRPRYTKMYFNYSFFIEPYFWKFLNFFSILTNMKWWLYERNHDQVHMF